MSATAPALLTDLLREVSRSFYITLRVLPGPVRPQIGVAYLLARATDTVADSEAVPVEDRLRSLEELRDRIVGGREVAVDFSHIPEDAATVGERALLRRIEEAVSLLNGFSCFDRCCIRQVLDTIVSGQAKDLERFHAANGTRLTALQTSDELDDYTFRVAGCVGEFWTRLCRQHLYPKAKLEVGQYCRDAVRFGKGLQRVNILRDLPVDLRKGRCYVPVDGLNRHALRPADLLDPVNEIRFRALYREHLEVAAEELKAGWRYTCATPREQFRVRLACALPLLIGAETLRLLAVGNVLDGKRRIKVPRNRVKHLLLQATLWHPFRRRWEALFDATLPAAR
ncbi:MAG: squalene/phytoene synthase family protein [Verrucomicrobiales bacterium]|nr:squalene/phytoene synthase family protein [Verrucomicrobiales bacterium]